MRAKHPDDTIAAISTPPGEGGIGIVRLSGPDAVSIVSQCFRSSSGRDIASHPHRVFHGEFFQDERPVDEVLVHVMRAPNSYTREDVVEINGHGGAVPLNAVLELVLSAGARLAEPGEFTKRAFLNGRIDLVQAEAVIDRIRAQTRAGLQAAAAAARGALSTSIQTIRDNLVDAKAYVEAAVDFPDDDLPELITPQLRDRLVESAEEMRSLLATADAGRLFREGAAIAIVGRPNVGKSSLFNALLRDARAIVTAQPGTTRDRLDESVAIDGIPVRLTDTAGVREAENEAERIGVDRAREAMEQAAAVILVLDASEAARPEDIAIANDIVSYDAPALLVLNKIDLEGADLTLRVPGEFSAVAPLSAVTGDGIAELESAIGELLRAGVEIAPDRGQLNRLHQKDSLRRALDAMEHLCNDFDASPEFLSMDLSAAIDALGEITGETTPDDLLERIFSSFCIGK